jgi:AcrR family transcriptional regulator
VKAEEKGASMPSNAVKESDVNPRVARRRGQILEAAARLFVNMGFIKTTMAEIAAEAGLSKPVIYTYFANKDEIIAALEEELVLRWGKAAKLEAPTAKTGYCDVIANAFGASFAFFKANPVLRALLHNHPHMFVPGQGAELNTAIERTRDRLAAFIKEGQQAGEIRADLDAAKTAELLRLVHIALIEQGLTAPSAVQWRDVGLSDLSIEVMISGIRAKPGRRSR